MDDFIHSSMTMVATFTPPTAQTMSGKTVYFSTTVMTGVRSTEGATEPETNSDSNSGVIHPEAQGRNGEGAEPGP